MARSVLAVSEGPLMSIFALENSATIDQRLIDSGFVFVITLVLGWFAWRVRRSLRPLRYPGSNERVQVP